MSTLQTHIERCERAREAELAKVTRIEVIDAGGRAFVRMYDLPGVAVDVQDDGRTLKVFAGEPKENQ